MSKKKKRPQPRKRSRSAGKNTKSRTTGRVQNARSPIEREGDRFGLPLPVEMRITPFGEGSFSDDASLPGLEWVDGYIYNHVAPHSPIRLIALAIRDFDGTLLGEMSLYPEGVPGNCQPGEYVIQVNPEFRRRGIGLLLLEIMDSNFPIDFTIQHYTAAGRALAAKYLSAKTQPTNEV